MKEADVYKLTVDCKEKVGTVPVTDGKITVNAEPKTGYVLYPAGSPAPVTAGDFGEGSHLKNPGFGTFNLKDWEITKNQGKAEVVQAENLETYLELTGDKGAEVTVSQTMTGLTPDKAATVYLFTQMGKRYRAKTAGEGRRPDLHKIGQTYLANLLRSEQIYRKKLSKSASDFRCAGKGHGGKAEHYRQDECGRRQDCPR